MDAPDVELIRALRAHDWSKLDCVKITPELTSLLDALRWVLTHGRPPTIRMHGKCTGKDCPVCDKWLALERTWRELRDAAGVSDDR